MMIVLPNYAIVKFLRILLMMVMNIVLVIVVVNV